MVGRESRVSHSHSRTKLQSQLLLHRIMHLSVVCSDGAPALFRPIYDLLDCNISAMVQMCNVAHILHAEYVWS